MDKIKKILRMLSRKEHEAMLLLMLQIERDYRKIPGLEPLQGIKGMFRVRIGNYRIIFSVHSKTKKTKLERISRRNEKTYKGL